MYWLMRSESTSIIEGKHAKTSRHNQVKWEDDTTGTASRCRCGVYQGMVQPLLSQSWPSMLMKQDDSPHRFVSQIAKNLHPSARLIHHEPSACVPLCRSATAFDTSQNWKQTTLMFLIGSVACTESKDNERLIFIQHLLSISMPMPT